MSFSLVEATISDLQNALYNNSTTSVELGLKYLQRIATYDIRGPRLNSIPILNPDVFDEAAASDARRASGELLGPLDGIPYTLKDSMKYKGMTCSSGSPALEHIVANKDSFVAEQLRKAGAVCIGRTTTPPMMASGMHRGVHGRAESPYNLDYLTAAFSSGSSNGSGTSTAASFAAFGLGSETVSSGRSPASNNGLVAYTPSRGMISPRGVWPLYPTCDVLVPHTRTVEDMLRILDILSVVGSREDGDFWRQQAFVSISPILRPKSFLEVKQTSPGALRGKTVAVPKMYINEKDSHPNTKYPYTSPSVLTLWSQARADLEALGATVIETDFPLVTNYEDDSITGHTNNVQGFAPDWNSKERGELVAYLWDDFLKENGDPNYPSLASIDGHQMFPRPEGYIPDRYLETNNFMNYPNLVQIAANRPKRKTPWDIEGISTALPALEAQRKRDLEDWVDRNNIDVVAFPANGDVGRADLENNPVSAEHALQNGVKYSNGNRALRHMGVPTVSVTMGMMEKEKIPVNVTFAGKHGSDRQLLEFAYEFEQIRQRRVRPSVTPALESDEIVSKELSRQPTTADEPPALEITHAQRISENEIEVKGLINNDVKLEAHIDHKPLTPSQINLNDNDFSIRATYTPFQPEKPLYGGVGKVVNNVLVCVLARTSRALVTGKLVLIDQNSSVAESQ